MRIRAARDHVLHANTTLVVDLATSLSSSQRLSAPRLLLPRSGLERSDFVLWHETDVAVATANVCFSNRPFGVKRFQAIHHHCGVDVAHGLVVDDSPSPARSLAPRFGRAPGARFALPEPELTFRSIFRLHPRKFDLHPHMPGLNTHDRRDLVDASSAGPPSGACLITERGPNNNQ
jgi:hypothetical protein